MISTASRPLASIECSTVVREMRFIEAIGTLSKPQTEKSAGTLYFISAGDGHHARLRQQEGQQYLAGAGLAGAGDLLYGGAAQD